MTGLLEGKVAIVTGGTSGIGLASVERFIREGAKVVVGDIADERGAELQGRLGDSVLFVHTDVTDDDAVGRLVSATVARFGRLDVMYNNAGAVGDPAGLTDLTADGFDKTLALLTRSVVFGHKHAARQFIAQGEPGSIITTASAAALAGGWSTAAYTIAKHAIVGVIRQAVAELAPQKIRSNAIAPGVILTPIVAQPYGVPPERAAEFAQFIDSRLGHTQPIGRFGQPDDIAKVATFLASDLSSFMTGAIIPVDGGATAINMGSIFQDVGEVAAEFQRS